MESGLEEKLNAYQELSTDILTKYHEVCNLLKIEVIKNQILEEKLIGFQSNNNKEYYEMSQKNFDILSQNIINDPGQNDQTKTHKRLNLYQRSIKIQKDK